MESKEILTLPRIVPMQRTIATTLSPVSSKIETCVKGRIVTEQSSELGNTRSCKSIQVKLEPVDHAKPTSSSIQLKKNKVKNKIKNKSRSEEELDISKKSIKDEILKLLQGLNSNSNCNLKDVREPKSKIKKVCRKCKHMFDECARFDTLRRSVSDYIFVREDSNANSQEKANEHIKDVIRQCLNIKEGELGEKVVYRDHILQEFVNKLQFLASRSEDHDTKKLIADNLEIRYDPKGINESCNYKDSNEYVVKDNFAARKRWHKDRNGFFYANNNCDDNNGNGGTYCYRVAKTEEELRNLIDLDVLAFTEKYRLNITTDTLYDLREELFDLFIMNLNNISSPNRNLIKRNTKKILENRGFTEFQSVYLTNILSAHWEDEFSNNDLALKPSSIRSDTFIIFPNITQNSSKYMKQSENSTPNEPDFSINEISQKDVDANVEVYVSRISDEINQWLVNLQVPQAQDPKLREAIVDELANDIVDRHKYLELNPSSAVSDASELENLKYQVFKWIYKLANNVDMTPVEHANDLMRRIQSIPVPVFSVHHRKLSSGRRSDQEAGLEASNQRINLIEPSNLHATSTRRLSSPDYVCCKKPTCKRNLNRTEPSKSTSDRNNSLREPENLLTTSTRRKSSPAKLSVENAELSKDKIISQPLRVTSEMNGTQTNVPPKQHPRSTNTGDLPYDSRGNFTGGINIKDDENVNTEHRPSLPQNLTIQNIRADIDKINEDYNEYLKEWIESIPIPVTNIKEEDVARAARMEIYNGVWDIVSKLRSEPETFNNRFLCEDIFDEEIEKLFSTLPQCPELMSKKQILKVKLIEKTGDANDLIKSSLTKSYKQQLIESVKGNVPKPIVNENQNPDILELYEELQILNLVEDFIICSRYQNEDHVISEAYRNKLLKRTKAFVEELKANHSKALNNIDTKLYLNDILEALKRVPVPSDDTIQAEADEILLGVEIEKWFSELPIVQNNDYVEQLHRRRLRNNLAKQIRDIEKGTNNTDSALDNTLKHEVSQFLGKAPLQHGESLNINAMVEDLIKRIKSRPKSQNESKRVAFNDPGYEEFSRNMPLSSTLTGYRRPSGGNNIENQNEISNKSIQAVPPSSELYHNIAKPLLDDLRSAKCCEKNSLDDLPHYVPFADDQPMTSSPRGGDSRWYTLQDSRHEYPQTNNSQVRNQSSRFVPHPAYNSPVSRHPEDRIYHRVDQHGIPEYAEEFVAPQKYSEQANGEEYNTMQRRDSSFPNPRITKRSSMNRSPVPIERHVETGRRMSNQIADRRWSNSPSSSPRRSDDAKLNQRSMRSDHIISSHRIPHQSSQRESVSNRPPFHDVVEDERPQMNRSDLFYRSTDQEGIRQTIEHNRSMEANLGGTIPEHYPEYYQPSVLLPPGYVPLRIGTKPGRERQRGGHIREGNAEGRYRGADSEVDMDEEDEIRCRCVEKMWKGHRRPRYCPFDDYDGYPMYLSTPYFYPYFY